jgi:predicted Zn-dependent protease with MMP-like domain
MFPNVLRDRIGLVIIYLSPHIIYGCINNYPADPAHQQHFHFILISHFEPAEIPEHLQISVVHDLYGLFVGVDIAKSDLQAQAIELVVQEPLTMAILYCATFDDMNQFFQTILLALKKMDFKYSKR